MTARSKLLADASALVDGDRDSVYGDPLENLSRIADLWTILFGRPFEANEVAMALVAVKLARLVVTGDHHDSWQDIAGYAAVGWEVS
jgi:hypothetical protein